MELNARVTNHSIQVYFLGKWRSLRYYQGKKFPPSPQIIKEAMSTFMLNAGYSQLPVEKQPTINLKWID